MEKIATPAASKKLSLREKYTQMTRGLGWETSEDYTAFKAVKLLYADSDHEFAILVAGIAAPPRRVLYCCQIGRASCRERV